MEESGDFRRGDEGVFKGEQCIFMAPPPQFVPQLMDDLFCWMKEAHGTVHPLILSSVFHYEFVFIHPFADGNGRMARLWHTAIISKWKPVFEYIPIESQIEKFQEEYYDAIAKCHVEGASTVFIEFMLSQIDKILDDISVQISEDNEQLSEYDKKLLDVMEYDVPYTSNTLMEKLGLKSKICKKLAEKSRWFPAKCRKSSAFLNDSIFFRILDYLPLISSSCRQKSRRSRSCCCRRSS